MSEDKDQARAVDTMTKRINDIIEETLGEDTMFMLVTLRPAESDDPDNDIGADIEAGVMSSAEFPDTTPYIIRAMESAGAFEGLGEDGEVETPRTLN